ncbi:MAG: hypothetical protein PHO54_01630 [Candidatus Peribacteraceae bacterium]|nr:hypothetical protein [Candidatus Peribacteraceae bacterium]
MHLREFPDDLLLDENATRETDPNGNQHVWVPAPSREQRRWMRLSIRSGANIESINEEIAALAIRIREYRQAQRTMMQKLLRRTPEDSIDAPVGKDGSAVTVTASGSSKKSLLVWAKNRGRHLDAETLNEVFPDAASLRELRDAWIVESTAEMPHPSGHRASVTEGRNDNDRIIDQFDAGQLQPTTPDELQLQSRLEQEESNFLRFGSDVLLPLVEEMPEDTAYRQNLKQGMRMPFEVLRANRHNPFRNTATVKRALRGSMIHFMAVMQSMANPHSFGYEIIPAEHQRFGVAGFEPMHRSMMLPIVPMESNCFFEMIKLHELVHVFQAGQRRKQMGLEKYFQFYAAGGGEKPVSFLEDEVQAYGQGIEGFNLLLRGAIKAKALREEIMDADEVCRELHIPDALHNALEMTLIFARDYYENNGENGQYPPAFVQQVLKMMILDGYRVFTFRGNRPELISA